MQDLLRFSLALCVVIFHYKHFAVQTALSLPPDDFAPPYIDLLESIYTYGYHAVAVFFFLSGHMLASQLPAKNDINSFSLRNFLIKRFARIYPAHFATLLFMALLSAAIKQVPLQPFMTYNDDPANFFASLIFLNGTGFMRDTSFNLPAWSLSVEVICYLMFGCICSSTTNWKSLFFFAALLLGVAINEISSNPNLSNVGSGMIFFFAGVLTATKLNFGRNRFIPNDQIAIISLSAICILSFLISLEVSLGAQKLFWIFLTLPSLVNVITLIDEKLNKKHHRPFIWFGMLSFSMYIWHFPVQAVIHYSIVNTRIDGSPPYNTALLFWLYFFSVIVAAHVSFVTIEKWGSSFIRSFRKE